MGATWTKVLAAILSAGVLLPAAGQCAAQPAGRGSPPPSLSALSAHLTVLDHLSAARASEAVARNRHLDRSARLAAARNAVMAYVRLGLLEDAQRARGTFGELTPPADQVAEVDFHLASAVAARWDGKSPDTGARKQARLDAIRAMESYWQKERGVAAAAGYLVQAAYQVQKLRAAGGDKTAATWVKKTVDAFARLKAVSRVTAGNNEALGSPQADLAAELVYAQLDRQIAADFDYDSGHHRYSGSVDEVLKAYEPDLKKAQKYEQDLESLVATYGSRAWSAVARARQGSLYDSCRTGLYNTRPPALRLFTPKEEVIFRWSGPSDDDLADSLDAIRERRREDWRNRRNAGLARADVRMVALYVEAFVRARDDHLPLASVERATRRLAFYTEVLGDAALRGYTSGVVHPSSKAPFVYRNGMFLTGYPGRVLSSPPNGLAPPLPARP